MESAWRHSWWEQPLARCHSQPASRGRAGTREEQPCVVGSDQAKSACAKHPPLGIRERTMYISIFVYITFYIRHRWPIPHTFKGLGYTFGEKACHPERSEGSGSTGAEILRFAQDDSQDTTQVRS